MSSLVRFSNFSETDKKLERQRILYESVKAYRKQIEEMFLESPLIPEYLIFVKNLEYEYREKYDRAYFDVHGSVPK